MSADDGAAPLDEWPGDHNHDHCIADALDRAEELCAGKGVRLTALRRRVLELIWDSHKPVGAYAILDILKDDQRSAAPPTVYRALDFLIEHGLVHRIQSLNAFVGCADPDHAHAGFFLICNECGDAVEIEDENVDRAVAATAKGRGFDIFTQTVEATGRCPQCRTA